MVPGSNPGGRTNFMLQDNEIVKRSLEIATEAHKGQTRWNGEPYITHPTRVAGKFLNNQLEYQHWKRDLKDIKQNDLILLTSIAYLHDVFEDNPAYKIEDLGGKLFNQRLTEEQCVTMSNALKFLTRFDKGQYARYIRNIREDWYATLVKLADLSDNLSDIRKPVQQAKYELAFLFLGGPFWHET